MRFRIRAAAMLLPLAAVTALGSCGLDNLTSSNSGDLPASLDGFAVAGDSVLIVGDSTLFTAELPAAVLGAAGVRFEWASDDATIAAVGADGRVRGVNPGTTKINAVVSSPSLDQPVVKSRTIRVRFNSLGFFPLDSITGLGGGQRLAAFGTKKDGTRHSFIDPVYDLPSAADFVIVGLNTNTLGALANTCTPPALGFCRVVAKATGTATIRMTYSGLTATALLRVVQVPTRIAFPVALKILSGIGTEESNIPTVFDSQDQVIPSPVLTWTSENPAVATVSAAGAVRAVSPGLAVIRVRVGAITLTYTARVVIPGPAAGLKFRAVTGTLIAGGAQTFTVDVVDVDGFKVPTASNTITLAQSAGTAGSLVGTLTASAVNGTATFTATRLRFTGSQKITASAPGLTGDEITITVTSAPAARIAFTTQPINGTQATNLSPVRVSVVDSIGNIVVTATNSITVALGANPGSSTLTGTTTAAAVAGIATYSDLRLNNLGTSYTLVANSTGFGAVTSAAFSIVGAPSRLRFSVQPTNGVAGTVLPTFTVQVQDASGNLVGNATTAVTIAVQSFCGTGVPPLVGTTTVNAASGTSTFTDIRLRRACAFFTLNVTSTGLSGENSAGFAVVPAPPAQFSITSHPATPMTAGCCANVTAQVLDSLGNLNTTTNVTATVSLGTNPTSTVMTGTTSKSSTNGSVNFNDLSITKTGTGYRLAVAATGLTSASSNTFDVQPNSANKLAFITNPASTVKSGVIITPAITVEVRDFFDNAVPGYSGTVDMTRRRADFGITASTLSGTMSVTVAGGRATFSDLVMTGVEGNPLVLVANVPGFALSSAISTTFTVVP